MSQDLMDQYIQMLSGESSDAVNQFYGRGGYDQSYGQPYNPNNPMPILERVQVTVKIRGMTSTPI